MKIKSISPLLATSFFAAAGYYCHCFHLLTVPYPRKTKNGLQIKFASLSPFGSRVTRLHITAPQDIADQTFDLAVIGAGPVGVSAALLAARSPLNKKVVLIDAPRASGALMNEATGEDLSIGGPTGLFSKALRDTGKRISVSSLKGMGLRDDRQVLKIFPLYQFVH